MFSSIPTRISLEIQSEEFRSIVKISLAQMISESIPDAKKERMKSDFLLDIIILIEIAMLYGAKTYSNEPKRRFPGAHEIATSLLFEDSVSMNRFLIELKKECEF